jgi:hypothetical protein
LVSSRYGWKVSCMFNSPVRTALIIDSYHEFDSNQFMDSSSRLNVYSFESGAVIACLALVFLPRRGSASPLLEELAVDLAVEIFLFSGPARFTST